MTDEEENVNRSSRTSGENVNWGSQSDGVELETAAREFICTECGWRNIQRTDGPEDVRGSELISECRNPECRAKLKVGEQDYELVRQEVVEQKFQRASNAAFRAGRDNMLEEVLELVDERIEELEKRLNNTSGFDQLNLNDVKARLMELKKLRHELRGELEETEVVEQDE